MNTRFKLEKDFKQYLYKYVSGVVGTSFVVFITLLLNFGIKMAGLIMYIFLVVVFFVMVVDIRLQYKLFRLNQEIKNIKNVLEDTK